MNKTHVATLAALIVAAAGWSSSAQAGELYTGIGTHGVQLGYAQPLSPHLTVRGDFGTVGNQTHDETEEGIAYKGKLKYQRTGLFLDVFPFANGFRFTTGVTFNNMKIDLHATGAGGTLEIGNTTYVTTAADYLNVKVEFPKTTPFLGIGYGHQLSSGWGFTFDLGASIGKAKVSETHGGPALSMASQADIDKELQELRDGVGKVKMIPMIAIGLNYRF